jgi:agmatine deiminase
MIKENNPKDVNYKPLAENWERIRDMRFEDGSKPEVIPLPMPAPFILTIIVYQQVMQIFIYVTVQ